MKETVATEAKSVFFTKQYCSEKQYKELIEFEVTYFESLAEMLEDGEKALSKSRKKKREFFVLASEEYMAFEQEIHEFNVKLAKRMKKKAYVSLSANIEFSSQHNMMAFINAASMLSLRAAIDLDMKPPNYSGAMLCITRLLGLLASHLDFDVEFSEACSWNFSSGNYH